MTARSNKAWRNVAIALACLAFVLIVNRAIASARQPNASTGSLTLSTSGKTLVVRIFADTDPEYLENLRSFVQWGIDPNDEADYVIVVQNTPAKTVRSCHTLAAFNLTCWLDLQDLAHCHMDR